MLQYVKKEKFMKQIGKITLAVALCSTLASAIDIKSLAGLEIPPLEFDRIGVSASAGAWYINWDQTSNASDRFGNKAIDTTYDIQSSIAPTVDFQLSYSGIIGNLSYTNSDSTAGQSNGEDSGVSALSLGLLVLGKIPYINLDVRYVKANFKGSISANDRETGNTGVGSFESNLDIYEIIVYPMNRYLGVGYRNYKYEVPQDLYIVNNGTNAIVTKGLADISYKGDFVEITLDNKKLIKEVTEYNGLAYSMTAGLGKLDATSAGYEQYLTQSDAVFYDLSLGYAYQHDSGDRLHYGLEVGYRYNAIDTSANQEGDYSMITEFTTEFYGPYASVNISY